MANKLDLMKYEAKYGRRPYWLSVLIGIDQLVNAILWGYVDETVSSRAYRCGRGATKPKKKWVIAEKVIDTIFFLDKENGISHCQLSYYGELAREHFPVN